MNQEREFIKNNIQENDTLVVACSGGPDSMCLLHLVVSLKDEMNINIVVAHVNHNLRKESKSEEKLVRDYARTNGLIFELYSIEEYKNGHFSEADARLRRYNFFEKVIHKHNAKVLLTAHHGDDLIETILMRLTRGSTLSGYKGINKVSNTKGYKIIRPLLITTKDSIINYLQDHNINYALDESNNNQKITRNRYRSVVIPFLKKENPKIHEKYLKFSEELAGYEDFVNNYILDKELIVDNQIVINKIINESLFIKRKALELLIKNIQLNDTFDINDTQMFNLIDLINKDNKSIDLSNGYKGINSYGYLSIKKIETKCYNPVILDKDISFNKFTFLYNHNICDTTNSCIYLNSAEIKLPLIIRTWQESDRMNVKNLKGTKKVSDIFIDSKISKFERKTYPIVVDSDNNILWIPNLKKSQFTKDKTEKYDIIIKCEAR